ncbi:MAG: DUF1152 domain-containing protein [Desulfurococcaceae archaeon]
MLCIAKPSERILIIGIGGGGDIASAAALSSVLEEWGFETVLASIAWERYIHDPIPGPIELDNIYSFVEKGEGFVIVNESSYAIRGGRRIDFQATRVARCLRREIYIIDLYGGVTGFYSALKHIVKREDIDLIIGLDVGGDSLATGCEENLWSPLADWIGLAGLSLMKGILAVHSPGSDGELSQSYILKRIDDFSRKGALRGVKYMCKKEADMLEKLLEHVYSEASRIPLLAYRGKRGIYEIRKGSRKTKITIFNTITFFLDTEILVNDIKPVKALLTTRSLREARSILHDYGIYTEYDLEEDLYKSGLSTQDITGDLLVEIRDRGRKNIRDNAIYKYCTGPGD